jgi:signal transduction histidine kinase
MTAELKTLVFIFLTVEAILFLVCGAAVMRKRSGQERAAALMLGYTLAAALVAFLDAAAQIGWLAALADRQTAAYLHWLEAFALAGVLLFLVRSFVKAGDSRFWFVVVFFWLAPVVVVFSPLLAAREVLWSGGTVFFTLDDLRLLVVFGGWSTFMMGAAASVYQVYRTLRQPMYKNRLAFLAPVFILLGINDMLHFLGLAALDDFLRLAGVVVLTYVMTRVLLQDVRQVLRQSLSAMAALGLIVGAYFGGVALQAWAQTILPATSPVLLGVGTTILAAGLGLALYNFLHGIIVRLVPIQSYNPSVTLRDYSLAISNIIDVERLATVAIGLIIEAMDIRRGFLFLVDKETAPGGGAFYRLRPVRGAGEKPKRSGSLNASSPIVFFFLQNRRPLLQYEIDFESVFRQAPANERDFLKSLDVEVYAPIYAKNEWIGMLALGAKSSGQRYTEDDLNVLTTIAHQTAVALENARLVDNLMRLNREIRQAYQALDTANRNLEHLERTKANFVSIASHELRTPLTVLRGYTEMLLDDPGIKENPNYLKTLQGIHKGTIRLHEIMDSMFDIAQIDARSIELHMQPVDLSVLIQTVCSGMAKSVQERQQTLSVEMDTIPAIKADPKTLRKVFYHLITNAIKFTPNGGKIRVLGRAVAPNQRDLPEGGVEIIVADTGVGVDPNARELIFTKFYQPEEDLNKHSTGKSKFKGSGSGLGLALSRGIVEAHGGRIWVESPGYDEVTFPGSQFHVVLPLRRQGESDTIRISSAVKLNL